MKWQPALLSVFLLFFVSSCSMIQPLSKRVESPRSEIETELTEVKELIQGRKFSRALEQLNSLNDQELSEIEKAEKYNLIGLISYSKTQYTQAKNEFEKANSFDFQSPAVRSQIGLNLAMTLYKMELHNQAFEEVKTIDLSVLDDDDRLKTNQLKYVLAKNENDRMIQAEALLGLISSQIQDETTLLNDKFFRMLSSHFSSMDYDDQLTFVSKNSFYQNFALRYLLQRTILFYEGLGQSLKASELRDLLNDLLGDDKQLTERLSFAEQLEPYKIGVILPLSGDKKEFAEKVLAGLTLSLKDSDRSQFKLIVKDGQDSAALSSYLVEQMILEENVALVIGGLFPSTSRWEYEAAKRHGALYLSLAPVYLEERSKNPLLIELSGSVESQMNGLINSGFLKVYGERYALIFPEDDMGKSYADSFWKMGVLSSANLTSLSSYSPETTDYRDSIKNVLGLAYPKERAGEYELWQEILSLKLRSRADRAQALKPEIDFNWVFLPSSPRNLNQLISTFDYFGAKDIVYVGGPSWRSSSLLSNQYRYRKLFFVDSLDEQKSSQLNLYFSQHYNRSVKLLESIGFDGMILATRIMNSFQGKKRSELSQWLERQKKIESFLGQWNLQGQLWIKKMELYQVRDGGFHLFNPAQL